MDKLFQGLFSGELANVISVTDFLLCISVSLALGLLMAVVCAWKDRHSKSFVITMGLLPAVVCVVIMMVNGNIGVLVACMSVIGLAVAISANVDNAISELEKENVIMAYFDDKSHAIYENSNDKKTESDAATSVTTGSIVKT